jgi:hypothetical protein
VRNVLLRDSRCWWCWLRDDNCRWRFGRSTSPARRNLLGIFCRKKCSELFKLSFEFCDPEFVGVLWLRWLGLARTAAHVARQIVFSTEVLAAQRTVRWSWWLCTGVIFNVTLQVSGCGKFLMAGWTGSLSLCSHNFWRWTNTRCLSFKMLFEL